MHHEFEALRAGDRIPADEGVAVLEMSGGGTPDEHGDDFVILEDELAKPVSCLAPGSKQVLVVKQTVGDLPVGGGFGGADAERGGAGRRMTGSGRADVHDETNPAFLCSFV